MLINGQIRLDGSLEFPSGLKSYNIAIAPNEIGNSGIIHFDSNNATIPQRGWRLYNTNIGQFNTNNLKPIVSGLRSLSAALTITTPNCGEVRISLNTSSLVTSVGPSGLTNYTGNVDIGSSDGTVLTTNMPGTGNGVNLRVNTASFKAVKNFNAATSWVHTHNLGSSGVIAYAYDGSRNWIIPDNFKIDSVNQVTYTWNTSQKGTSVVHIL